MTEHAQNSNGLDWPTLALLACCYLAFGLATTILAETWPWVAFVLLTLVVTLHSSLQHEILHGHLSRNRLLAVSAVFPAIGMFIPYERFRDTHLDHHRDENLTDPHEDPESNYLDPALWATLPIWQKMILRFNNTLSGRMIVGPAISMIRFWWGDLRAAIRGDSKILQAYILHAAGMILVLAWLSVMGKMSIIAYLAACYAGLSLLKVRTFLEHRAHGDVPGRTVIVEDRGLLALLFLNNNFHALHHEQPELRWYELPAAYAARRNEIIASNDHYFYQSYGEVFRQYLFRSKDQIPHPFYETRSG